MLERDVILNKTLLLLMKSPVLGQICTKPLPGLKGFIAKSRGGCKAKLLGSRKGAPAKRCYYFHHYAWPTPGGGGGGYSLIWAI